LLLFSVRINAQQIAIVPQPQEVSLYRTSALFEFKEQLSAAFFLGNEAEEAFQFSLIFSL
jgi:hypothetical protein